MAEGGKTDEARIVVTFDTRQARAALDELARHGQQAVSQMGWGDAWRTPPGRGGGGPPGGGSGGARTPPAPPGGAGGGGAAQAALASRGIGLRGLGAAGAMAMSVPGVAPMAGAVTGGIYGGARDALGALPKAVTSRVETMFFGTGAAEGRGENAALERIKNAYGYLAGSRDADASKAAVDAARPVFEQLREYETRRELGEKALTEGLTDVETSAGRFLGASGGIGGTVVAGLLGKILAELIRMRQNTDGMNR